MVRGKKAAQAAQRRSTEATGRVAALEAALRAARAAHKAEVDDLRRQLLQLRSDLDQEAQRRAQELIAVAEAEADRRVEAAREDTEQRVDRLQRLLIAEGLSRQGELLARRALSLFGRALHVQQPDGSSTREQRRMEKYRPDLVEQGLATLLVNPDHSRACACGQCC